MSKVYWTKERIARRRKVRFARKNAYLQLHGPCKNCGSWDNLEFHHRDPDTKVKTVEWSSSKSIREIELNKCDILCPTCHTLAHPIEHGTRSTYDTYRCRCAECIKAHKVYRHNYYLKTGT